MRGLRTPGPTETFDGIAVLIDRFLEEIGSTYERSFGGARPEYREALRATGTMAMEILADTDALYHDAEHSMLVTLVGQEILRGRFLLEGGVSSRDWLHFVVSLLCHDIGYVRGICPGDAPGEAVIDETGRRIAIPPGATDAFLTAHHVDRGKLFVRWRFRDHPLIDADVVAANIENTRFPVPEANDQPSSDYPGLVRAADLIGQLADPAYLTKLPALYHEFVETGKHEAMGYACPDDVREKYPDFYWKMVAEHVEDGLRYLRATREGRRWIAGLYSHIFAEEHREQG